MKGTATLMEGASVNDSRFILMTDKKKQWVSVSTQVTTYLLAGSFGKMTPAHCSKTLQ